MDKTKSRCATINVLGVGISITHMADTLKRIGEWIETAQKNYICVTTVHSVIEAQNSPTLKTAINESGLCIPDGRPLYWIGKAEGHKQMRQVCGQDLLLECCEKSVQTGWCHFFYGGKEGVAKQLAENMQQRYPHLKVAGTYCPPFRDLNNDEQKSLKKQIAAAQPDIIWVGLGAPKQDLFMAEYIQQLDVPVMIGVGAAFDVYTGNIPETPRWIRNAGLEWLFRLGCEPKRLWKRYLVYNSLFVAQLAKQKLLGKNYPKC